MNSIQVTILIILAAAILFVQILMLVLFRRWAFRVVSTPLDASPFRFDTFRSFRRASKIIFGSTALGSLLGFGTYLISLNVGLRYTAEASIEVLPKNGDPFRDETPSINLDPSNPNLDSFLGLIDSQGYLDDLLRLDAVQKTGWFRKASVVETPGFNGEDFISQLSRNLRYHLRVRLLPGNRWVMVSLSCDGLSGKNESAFILNEIIQICLKKQQNITASQLVDWIIPLRNQQTSLLAQLNSAEDSLKKLLTGSGFSDLLSDAKDSRLFSLLTQLELRRLDVRSQLASIDSKIQLVEQKPSKTPDDSTVHGMNIQLDSTGLLESDKEETPAEKSDMEIPVDSPAVSSPFNKLSPVTLSDDLDELHRQRILLANQERIIQQEIDETKKAIHQRSLARAEAEPLLKKREGLQKSLDQIQKTLQKMEMVIQSPLLSGLRLYPAKVPEEPSSPRLAVHIPVGLALGYLVGMGIAIGLQMREARLRSQFNEIARLEVPLLGIIRYGLQEEQPWGLDMSEIFRRAPLSPICEEYRKLSVNLRQLKSAIDKKILLFTSPNESDGKTMVTANLARILLSEGRKVLFVDSNIRHPASTRLFPRSGENDPSPYSYFGLSNCLMGQSSDVRQIIRAGGIDGLEIMDSGPIPPNPEVVFEKSRIRNLLNSVRDSYDDILIDGPAMQFNEALSLAAAAEGTLVVLDVTRLGKGQPERVLQELKIAEASVLGTVLVGITGSDGRCFLDIPWADPVPPKPVPPIIPPVRDSAG